MPAKIPDDRDEKLKSIFLAAPVGIGMVTNRIILEVNDTLCRMTGYSKGEIIGRDAMFLYPTIEEYNYVGEEKYERIRRTGIGTVETRWKRKDGIIIDIILSSVPLDMDDFSKGVTFTALDITERKNYERALLESEKKLKTYIENSPDAIFIADSSGIMHELNSRVEDMTGYSMEELIGRHIREIHIEEEISLGIEHFHKVLKEGKSRFEFRLKKKDGGDVPVLVEAALLPDGRVIGYCRDISERKMYEEKLKEYSEKLKHIADNIPGILYQYNVSSSERAFKYINEKAAEVFGIDISRTDYLDEYIRHIHPEYREKFISSIEKAIAEKTGWFFEWSFIHQAGDIRWYRAISNPEVKDDELIFYGVIQDITDGKETQIALMSSESRYRELIELAVDGIIIATGEGIITDVNSQLEKMTGKTKKELTGMEFSKLFTEESLKRRPVNYNLLKKGETIINERVIKRDDGVNAIVETHSKMMPDGTFQSIFRDITERKISEEALSAEKERLAVTLRSIGDGVIATDNGGRILLMNSVAETLTGWKFDECGDKTLGDIFVIMNEYTRITGPDIIGSVLKSGNIVELASDMVLVSRDGREIIISDSGAPIRDSCGEITGVVIVFRDITEKRKMAESLNRAQKLDSLATLAGGIAHDFNNMLGGILGYIDLARNYSRNSEDISSYLDKAMTVFDRAKNLTSQLMTFARGGEPSIRTDDISSVLKEYSISALMDSGRECLFDIPEDLWLAAFDRIQIGQVVYNIVINARDFIESDGEIKISAANIELARGNREQLKPGRYVKVEIMDNGRGIPCEVLPHIFDPFFTTRKNGSGLGLSTSYSIVLRHGGRLDVDSSIGSGTRFWFYLPAVLPETAVHAAPEFSEHIGSGLILVMDDEYFIREIISQMLEHMGYKTVQASNGAEMLSLYNDYKENPELKCIILDLTIPGGMGGRETVAEIRKLNSKIPVFASSGYSGDRIIANPEEYGFTDSIRKPFTVNELSVLLNSHIKQ